MTIWLHGMDADKKILTLRSSVHYCIVKDLYAQLLAQYVGIVQVKKILAATYFLQQCLQQNGMLPWPPLTFFQRFLFLLYRNYETPCINCYIVTVVVVSAALHIVIVTCHEIRAYEPFLAIFTFLNFLVPMHPTLLHRQQPEFPLKN